MTQQPTIEGLQGKQRFLRHGILFLVAGLCCLGGFWWVRASEGSRQSLVIDTQAAEAERTALEKPKGASWRDLAKARNADVTASGKALREELFWPSTVDKLTPLAAKEFLEQRIKDVRSRYETKMPLPESFGIQATLTDEAGVPEMLVRATMIEALLELLSSHECETLQALQSAGMRNGPTLMGVEITFDAILPARTVPLFLQELHHPGKVFAPVDLKLEREDGATSRYHLTGKLQCRLAPAEKSS